MKEARDIAGFSVPFVAATALTAYIIPDNVPWIQTASSVTFCLFAISASVLLLQEANFRSNRISLLPAIVCASLCGCCICLNAKILSVSWAISPIRLWAEGFCQGMGETIDKIPFSDTSSASLLKALLTGNKSDLPASVRTSFRLAGASHILALSGLHLGIIYMIVDKTLSLAGNGPVIKIIRNLATVVICGFYSLATGAGPSITRAFIFILTAQTGKLLCRKISLKHTILSSLLIQLTISPLSIREAGLQLSYLAVGGIAWIYPHLRDIWESGPASKKWYLPSKGPLHWIWDTAALSISCQIATAPLAWLHFGTFPTYFLISNLICLPLTSLVIPTGLLCCTASAIGICPNILVTITEVIIRAMISSMEIISTM